MKTQNPIETDNGRPVGESGPFARRTPPATRSFFVPTGSPDQIHAFAIRVQACYPAGREVVGLPQDSNRSLSGSASDSCAKGLSDGSGSRRHAATVSRRVRAVHARIDVFLHVDDDRMQKPSIAGSHEGKDPALAGPFGLATSMKTSFSAALSRFAAWRLSVWGSTKFPDQGSKVSDTSDTMSA